MRMREPMGLSVLREDVDVRKDALYVYLSYKIADCDYMPNIGRLKAADVI